MSLMRSFTLALLAVGAACNGGGGAGNGKEDTGDARTEDSGGGNADNWRPSGSGYAWFVDGGADNSRLHLELSRCIAPVEGESYYGFLSRGGADVIALGEIPCEGEEVWFEGETGVDLLLGGYDTFQAFASAGDGDAPEGTPLWEGRIDPALLDTIAELVIASPSTPEGEGTLRSAESQIEALVEYTSDVIDETLSVAELQVEGERIANAIEGGAEDYNDDGQVETLEGTLPLLGAEGYVNLILQDLDGVSASVEPGDPIKDYANYAYDCVQRVESHAELAAVSARVASACGAESSCDDTLGGVVVELEVARAGYDENGDGVIDTLTEGTVECALYYVAQMARMEVGVP